VPLITYDFAAQGASGSALIDGKTVKTLKHQRRLKIYAAVLPGNHQFRSILDQPAILTFMVSSDEFKYCQR
jgi:hypothetical protein